MNSQERVRSTDKGPIPERAENVLPVEIDYDPKPPAVKVIPCGCGPSGVLTWDTFPHMIYTIRGEQLEIQKLSGYKCHGCSLVLLLPDAAGPINDGVEMVLREEDQHSTS